MIRLAYFISRYPAVSHTFILREVRELRALGVEVHTASVNPPDRPLEDLGDEERNEANFTHVLKRQPPARIVAAFARTIATRPLQLIAGMALALRLGGLDLRELALRVCYLAEAILLGEWMRRKQLTRLHVHFATPASTVALLVQRVFGVSFSMTVHGPDEFYEVRRHHLKEKIAAASFICCIGNFCRSQLMKLSEPRDWEKLELSPLGVDPAEFHRPERTAAEGPFRILCVGRLVPAKGQAVLIEAMRLLRAHGRRASLVIAGDGPDRPRLQALSRSAGVAADCRFLGVVDPTRVRELYEQSDLFALPSFAEGVPVVLMEAMAMEVPCISTTVNGIPELIESGRHGLLAPPSDAAALCAAIETLMDDAQLRRRLAAAGRRKVMADYDLRTNVRRLETIFRRRMATA